MNTNTAELTSTMTVTAEPQNVELNYEQARESFRQQCARVIHSEDNAAQFNERAYRSRRVTATFKMLTSYLEGQVFEDDALYFLESAADGLLNAVGLHGREIINHEIICHAEGRELTSELRAEVLSGLIAAEPEYSPYYPLLVEMLKEVNGTLPGVLEA
ncbi:hypothetical protein [Citrobacter arsenatis]|uniref:hypothetical protein n=1 Tax=Citrobacter arsenatis TaxID=2546350 RepID=UPI00300E5244